MVEAMMDTPSVWPALGQQHPFSIMPDVQPAGISEDLTANFGSALKIKVHSEPQLILELFGKGAHPAAR